MQTQRDIGIGIDWLYSYRIAILTYIYTPICMYICVCIYREIST